MVFQRKEMIYMEDFGIKFFRDKGTDAQRNYLEHLRNEAVMAKLKGLDDLADAIVVKIKNAISTFEGA